MGLLTAFKFIFIFVLVQSFSWAITIDYETLKKYPNGIAKDYYIYRYLTEGNLTKQQVEDLSKQITRMNSVLRKALSKKIIKKPIDTDPCKSMDVKTFLKSPANCQTKRLNPSFAMQLSKKDRKLVYDNIKTAYPKIQKWLQPLVDANKTIAISKTDSETYMKLFLNLNRTHRLNYFNHEISEQLANNLTKHPNFYTLVQFVVIQNELPEISTSFLKINPKEKELGSESGFYLGINAVKQNKIKTANNFFLESAQKSRLKEKQDKALFWAYLCTKDKTNLEKISKSNDLNFYSILSREKLNLLPQEVFFPKPKIDTLTSFSITDPFAWQNIRTHISGLSTSELKEYAKKFFTKETLPYYSYMMERASNYKNSYFIVPYDKYLQSLNNERKIIILALARQESHFIPASISTSYALGMMQIMPFLSRHIAKEKKIESFDIDKMFEPSTAYEFADHHLDYLTKHLQHPLFIAYAYNGGIGFTKRMLKQGNIFEEGKFEPYLSMELVHYAESRYYGKKVLANYVTYARMFDINASMTTLVQNLTKPHLTDSFRDRTSK